MNRQFYEFWGNFFTRVAQGQKQMEDLTAWMAQGFSGTGDLAGLLRRCYGLEGPEKDQHRDFRAWQKTVEDFQEALAQLARQWGWVPQAEHRRLSEKCETLEAQVRSQQATIAELRDLLEQKGLGHAELFRHMKSALKEQSDQFQALMESIHGAQRPEDSKKDRGGQPG